jgi:PAS domain S-box-containing protein
MHTQRKDGSMLIWLFNNVLEEDADGNQYVIGNAVDITERHQLESDLKRTKEMLEETNEVARIGAWDLDLSRKKLFWSAVTKAIHEVPEDYTPEYDQAISFYHGEHQQTILDAVNSATGEGKAIDVEVQIITDQGNTRWVRSIGKPEFENGHCVRLYGTFQDIDDKKKAEQELINEKLRLAAFVEHSPAAVAMMDTQYRFIAVSKRYRENYQIKTDVIGRSQFDVFPDLSERWQEICRQALEGQSAKGDEDKWRPEGLDYDLYLRWEILPWYKFDGSIGGIMVFTEDITASCMQREELQRSKLHAEQASIAKSEFLANMSHEIRTPLNGVIGFTDLVLKTELNSTQHQYLSIVNQSANALLSIINDILDFSKIEAGKLELDIERCDLFETCSQAADIVTYQVQKKGLEMLVNIQPDLPRYIWTDAVRIKQVLVNLLGNAVKFTEKGEIELKIMLLNSSESTWADFRFEVRDTGIGIKEEKQSKIFDAFSQEDASTTKRYGGTGLGLTISNKLLGMMGSRLQLKSKPGQGSSFYFDIRLKAEKGEPEVSHTLDHIKRALIVDDNNNNRLILKQLLELKDIVTDEAASGFEALHLLAQQNQYDLIIMDYHMPFMDGIETIRKIRENFSGSIQPLPIMMLHSSSDDETIIRACQELDVRHRMVKPVKMQELYYNLYRLTTGKPELKENQEVEQPHFEDHKLTVLVVEDNLVNKLLAKSILGKVIPNATILEADNGEEALQLYLNADLILMDIQMPVMNGYEAAERIRALETDRRVPIIALTAGNVKGEKEKCLAAGMDDFVAKPFVEDTIIQLFNVWLKRTAKDLHDTASGDGLIRTDHFDPEALKKYVGEDEELSREILRVTVKELDLSTVLLSDEKMLPELKTLGHKLYGTAVCAGMYRLAECAKQLELMEDDKTPSSQDIIKQIRAEIELVKTFVVEYLTK